MYDECFKKLRKECEIRTPSSNTARTYTDNIKRFLLDVDRHPDQLQIDDARQCILKKRLNSGSAQKSCSQYRPAF